MAYKKLSSKMYALIEDKMGIKKDEASTYNDNEELRRNIVNFMFDFECDEIMKSGGPDGIISEDGETAANIVTYLSPLPPEENQT